MVLTTVQPMRRSAPFMLSHRMNGVFAPACTNLVVSMFNPVFHRNQIEISVNDTGPGLPLGKADQIFDAFSTTKPLRQRIYVCSTDIVSGDF